MPPEFDREQILAELQAEPEGAAEGTGAPTEQEIEQYEYLLGDQSNKLPANAEFKINHNGQVVQAPLSKVVNAFRLRSKLDDDMASYKGQLSEFEKKQKELGDIEELKSSLQPMQQLQAWSQDLEMKDPAAFRHLHETIEKIKNGLWSGNGAEGGNSAANAVITDLRTQLDELKTWKGEFEQQKKDQEHPKYIVLFLYE